MLVRVNGSKSISKHKNGLSDDAEAILLKTGSSIGAAA